MENWKIINDYPNYEISNLGNVRNLKNKKLLKFWISKGYHRIGLYGGKKQKIISVHRLVAQAFIPNLNNKPQINHINHVRNDNRIENLEWVTNLENSRHKISYKKRKITLKELNIIYNTYIKIGLKETSKKYDIDYSSLQTLLFYMHPKY